MNGPVRIKGYDEIIEALDEARTTAGYLSDFCVRTLEENKALRARVAELERDLASAERGAKWWEENGKRWRDGRDEENRTLRARVASLEAALRRAHGLYCSCDKHNNGLCPAAAALAAPKEDDRG